MYIEYINLREPINGSDKVWKINVIIDKNNYFNKTLKHNLIITFGMIILVIIIYKYDVYVFFQGI